MQKQVTPGGEIIYVSSDEHFGKTILYEGSCVEALLKNFFFKGKLESVSGRIVEPLREELMLGHDGEAYSHANISQGLRTLEVRGCIKREIRGKRTFKVTMQDCVIPQSWWNRLKQDDRFISDVPPELEGSEVTISMALDHLVESILLLKQALETRLVNTDSSLSVDEARLRAENAQLQDELNRVSLGMRAVVSSSTTPKTQNRVDAGELDLRSLGVSNSRIRALFRHAHQSGFRIEKTDGGHIVLFPPNVAHKPVYTSSTPSDHRVYDNLYAQLVRTGMPKMEKK